MEHTRWLWLILVSGFVVLLLKRLGKLFNSIPPASPLTLGLLIGIASIGLSPSIAPYYYVFIIFLPLLNPHSLPLWIGWFSLCIFTIFISLFNQLPNNTFWLDEQYVLISLATLLMTGYALWHAAALRATHQPPKTS